MLFYTRYKVGDRDAQEWSEAAFFYAPPAARDVWSRPLSDRLREIEADARANPSAFANAGEGEIFDGKRTTTNIFG